MPHVCSGGGTRRRGAFVFQMFLFSTDLDFIFGSMWSDQNSIPMEAVIGWLAANMKGKTLIARIFRVLFTVAIYYLWRECNLRIFQGKSTMTLPCSA